MNVYAFNIKTVPDLDAGRKFWNLGDLGDEQVGAVMHSKRRQETGSITNSLRQHFQKVVSISAIYRVDESIKIWSLGEGSLSELDSTEGGLLREFYGHIQAHSPALVSWNGAAFDLPVLHYRALVNKVSAPKYWDSESRYVNTEKNYFQEGVTPMNIDLMDLLGGTKNVQYSSLTEIAVLLGFPNTADMNSREIFEAYLTGDTEIIRKKSKVDLLKLWFVYLNYQNMTGQIDINIELERTRNCLASSNQIHASELVTLWQAIAPF
jgi:predicted PolB exonuclease-like 3'-5' exonuclease